LCYLSLGGKQTVSLSPSTEETQSENVLPKKQHVKSIITTRRTRPVVEIIPSSSEQRNESTVITKSRKRPLEEIEV
jgi:hypothetical protein